MHNCTSGKNKKQNSVCYARHLHVINLSYFGKYCGIVGAIDNIEDNPLHNGKGLISWQRIVTYSKSNS